MSVCEGCGAKYKWDRINEHRVGCDAYLTGAKDLHFPCVCGLRFSTERSLRSHKKGHDRAAQRSFPPRAVHCLAVIRPRATPSNHLPTSYQLAGRPKKASRSPRQAARQTYRQGSVPFQQC